MLNGCSGPTSTGGVAPSGQATRPRRAPATGAVQRHSGSAIGAFHHRQAARRPPCAPVHRGARQCPAGQKRLGIARHRRHAPCACDRTSARQHSPHLCARWAPRYISVHNAPTTRRYHRPPHRPTAGPPAATMRPRRSTRASERKFSSSARSRHHWPAPLVSAAQAARCHAADLADRGTEEKGAEAVALVVAQPALKTMPLVVDHLVPLGVIHARAWAIWSGPGSWRWHRR